MIIVLLALVYLANAHPTVFSPMSPAGPISLQPRARHRDGNRCAGLMGIPWDQAVTAGSLMGIKTILNELIAYVELSSCRPRRLDARSRLIMLYAMCGFANFGSLGIMIGGLATMAPERREGRGRAGSQIDRVGYA